MIRLTIAAAFLTASSTLVPLAVTQDTHEAAPLDVTEDALIATLHESGSLQQLETMQTFAAQASAPEAMPRLLEILRDEAPRMDNNVCLAIELILVAHPEAACPLEPLIEVLERKIWNSQQKAAQAVFRAIDPTMDEAGQERLACALIPLLTNQRSRVYDAAQRCLQKLSGEEHPPVPEPWVEWYERRFEKGIVLDDAVYEMIAVVQTVQEDEHVTYLINGQALPDAPALEARLRELAELAAKREVELAGIVQVTEATMNEIARTMEFGAVAEPIGVFERLKISGTVSPESDVFRPPWVPAPPGKVDGAR